MQLIIIYVVAITFGHFVKEVKTGCTLEPKIDENEDALILQESIRSGEGQISHSARVIIDGGATKLEGERVLFFCETKAESENVTVKWFHEGVPINEVASRDTTVMIRKDGLLFINPVRSNDSGQYSCEIGNSIGEPQTASAYLEVQYLAKVIFTPPIQYLPFGFGGVINCYIKANPPLQYVVWTKNKHFFDPYQTNNVVYLNNGSLFFTRVNESHQGRYTC